MQSSYSDESQLSHGHGQPPASVRSQSLRSPSGTSLPEITCFFPTQEDRAATTKLPQRWQSVNSNNTYSTQSSDASSSDSSQYTQPSMAIDVIPEHSASPLNSPRELSPVTPAYHGDDLSAGIGGFTESNLSTGKAAKQRARVQPVAIDAFLAGEAKPLTLEDDSYGDQSDLPLRKYQQPILRVQSDVAQRPDSSRARLGLRASMLVASDATPWEPQHGRTGDPSSPRATNRNRLPKALALLKR